MCQPSIRTRQGQGGCPNIAQSVYKYEKRPLLSYNLINQQYTYAIKKAIQECKKPSFFSRNLCKECEFSLLTLRSAGLSGMASCRVAMLFNNNSNSSNENPKYLFLWKYSNLRSTSSRVKNYKETLLGMDSANSKILLHHCFPFCSEYFCVLVYLCSTKSRLDVYITTIRFSCTDYFHTTLITRAKSLAITVAAHTTHFIYPSEKHTKKYYRRDTLLYSGVAHSSSTSQLKNSRAACFPRIFRSGGCFRSA